MMMKAKKNAENVEVAVCAIFIGDIGIFFKGRDVDPRQEKSPTTGANIHLHVHVGSTRMHGLVDLD